MGNKEKMMKLVVLFAVVAASLALATAESTEEPVEIVMLEESISAANRTMPEVLDPTKAAAIARKDFLGRSCMNQCGGLCRQLCAKFKALKVCNGCVRGCLNKCTTGGSKTLSYDPFNLPAKQATNPIA